MAYEDYSPEADKLINPLGEVTTYSGEVVDLEAADDKYKSYSPKADKYIKPNGDIVTFAQLLAEAVESYVKVVKEKTFVYQLPSPTVGIEIPTGYIASDGDSTKAITVAFQASEDATGDVYDLDETIDVDLALLQPMIRFSRTVEFPVASGQAKMFFWLDDGVSYNLNEVIVYLDFDGGSKTAELLSITETNLVLEAI